MAEKTATYNTIESYVELIAERDKKELVIRNITRVRHPPSTGSPIRSDYDIVVG